MSKWLRVITLLLIMGICKAHHTIRVVILAALGLIGLWMMHNLAQDFNKIFTNIQGHLPASSSPKTFLVKRSIGDSYYDNNSTAKQTPEPHIDWERILSKDPVGCTRSLVCQLVASTPKELSAEESNILLLIRLTTQKEDWASKQLQGALKYGKLVSPAQCRNRYKFCPYSSKTMMTILRLFGGT